jgi:hypothetical protein
MLTGGGRAAGGRHDQQRQPQGKAAGKARQHACAVAVLAHHPQYQPRCELRGGGKGQRAHAGEVGDPGKAAVEGIGRSQQGGDHHAADQQQACRHAATVAPTGQRAAQQQRSDKVVGDHDRQRHAGDHDHAGGCRKSTEKHQHRQPWRAARQRQREHHGVGICARRQHREARQHDRHDHSGSQRKVGRQHPSHRRGGTLSRGFDEGHVELARQAQDRRRCDGGEYHEARIKLAWRKQRGGR